MQHKKQFTVTKQAVITLCSILGILAVYLMITAFTGNNNAVPDSPNTELTVIVTSGDTLWDIAKENNPKQKNVRDRIDEIMKYNNKSDCDIFPGEQLIIPA